MTMMSTMNAAVRARARARTHARTHTHTHTHTTHTTQHTHNSTHLPVYGDPRPHVDDVALHFADVRECKLASRKVRNEVELEKVLHVFDRELVDRLWWRVPSSVVDQAVDAAKLLDGRVNQILNVGNLYGKGR
jgi:hypothetical protein